LVDSPPYLSSFQIPGIERRKKEKRKKGGAPRFRKTIFAGRRRGGKKREGQFSTATPLAILSFICGLPCSRKRERGEEEKRKRERKKGSP